MSVGILKSKKGQLQLQETILAVFVFVIIIIIGMFVFINYQNNSIKKDFDDFNRIKTRINIITLNDIPELGCSKSGIKENCVDDLKLIAFKNLAERRKAEYAESYGYMNITFYQVYPEKNNKECDKDNLENCGVWNIYDNKPKTITSRIREATPISLYNVKEDKYKIYEFILEMNKKHSTIKDMEEEWIREMKMSRAQFYILRNDLGLSKHYRSLKI